MLTTLFPKIEKSVFIVTYGRSGSTLLQNMLNTLPGYLIRGENNNVLAPLAQAWNIIQQSEYGSALRASGEITTSKDPWFGYENVSEQTFGDALACSFIKNILGPNKDTRVIGFKEIRWHADPVLFPIMLSFLYQFFPDAKFIFNIREHSQVVRSGWWKNMQEDVVRKQLSQAESLYADFVNTHPKQCITLHYNDYITGASEWRPLFGFLGESFDLEKVTEILENRLQHLKPRTVFTKPTINLEKP